MGREDKHSTKHKRHHDHDERKSKKRHKSSKSESTKSSRHKEPSGSIRVVDDDPNEDDMWEEKNVDMDGEKVRFDPHERLTFEHELLDVFSLLPQKYQQQRPSN